LYKLFHRVLVLITLYSEKTVPEWFLFLKFKEIVYPFYFLLVVIQLVILISNIVIFTFDYPLNP